MKISRLANGVKCKITGVDCEVSSLAANDFECRSGSIFFNAKGNNSDGMKYILNAVKNGAVAIVSTEYVDCGVTCVVTEDVRRALTDMCKNFYDNPQNKMKTIGIVGTDGKTTVCETICKLLNDAGIDCGKIGTSGASFKEREWNTGMTTPDSPALYSIMSEMADMGARAVCLELSAHAIYFKKADFIFDILVFTNCTRDHLDFFKSVEEYRSVKMSAFDDGKCKVAVVNADDPLGIMIALDRKSATITYGIEQPSDVFALDLYETTNGVSFIINLFDRLYDVYSKMIGRFNVYNLLAVATVCSLCGVKIDFVAEELSKMTPVCGRMQKVHGEPAVYIDYAHTPEGLHNALLALRNITSGKLICVFGCGGDRDCGKRREMGCVGATFADFCVITCDNPRFEDANSIIREIEEGARTVAGARYVTVTDRKQAIEYALSNSGPDDVVIIAGKGAERYQDVMGVKLPYSDEETACAFFDKNRE